MLARQVVLLTPPGSSHPCQLLSRQQSTAVSPLDATLMNHPASVAKKRLTARLNPLDATLTKNTGRGAILQAKVSHSSPMGALGAFRAPNLPTFQRSNELHRRLPSSVHSSKFRIPQVLCLPLLRKLPGCIPTIPILELATLPQRFDLPSFAPPARRPSSPIAGAGNGLPVYWTSYQFSAAEPGCILKVTQSEVRT